VPPVCRGRSFRRSTRRTLQPVCTPVRQGRWRICAKRSDLAVKCCISVRNLQRRSYLRRGDEEALRRGLVLFPPAPFPPFFCLGDLGDCGDFLRGDEEGERALRPGEADLRRGDVRLGDLALRPPPPCLPPCSCLVGRSGAPAWVNWNSLPPAGFVFPAQVGTGMCKGREGKGCQEAGAPRRRRRWLARAAGLFCHVTCFARPLSLPKHSVRIPINNIPSPFSCLREP
jgi:hypothetical protein